MTKDEAKCPICHSVLILDTSRGSRSFLDYDGHVCHSMGSVLQLNGVHCPKCMILFHIAVLGDFIIEDKSPYWRPVTNETCENCGELRITHHEPSDNNDWRSWDAYDCRHRSNYGVNPRENRKGCIVWTKKL